MLKKLLLIIMCLCLALAVGCKKEPEVISVNSEEDVSSEPEVIVAEPEYAVNPLTGVKDLALDKSGDRPVAITVNNISVAQPVQTGLNKADIIIFVAIRLSTHNTENSFTEG